MMAPLRHTAWGVEKRPIDVTCTLSYVAGGRGKEPEDRVSDVPAPSSTFSGLCDESLRDIVRRTFQPFIKLIQCLHICTESFCLSNIVCYCLLPLSRQS